MSLNDELWGWLGKKPEGDFTTDLSLCFKWIVPKVTKLGYEVRIITAFEGYVVGILRHSNCEIVASDNNTIAALAFCLAVRKIK